MLPRLQLPPSPAILALIAAAFILPGLASHDLWKTQDAIALGIAHGMATSGDLVLPRVAGVAWLEDQPLYHWCALALGLALGSLIEFHAAARLASGAFVAAALFFIYRAAAAAAERDEDRRTAACAALLCLLGSVGLLVQAHEALPELAALAALCAAFAFVPRAIDRPLSAGLGIGAALGLALLSAAWMAPAGLAAALVAAHFVCPQWRSRTAAPFLGAAFVIAAGIAIAWPLALRLRHPEAFDDWWALVWQQASAGENLRHFFSTASWYTWPAWPLAGWALWSLRGRWREPELFVPAASALAMAGLLVLFGPPHDEHLVPLLAPLVLLAAQGIFTLRRGAVAALDWFGVLTFAVFTGLVWLGYFALVTGVPAPMARNFGRIAPGFVAQLEPLALLFAVLLAAAWLYLVLFTPFSPVRSVARWAAGMVLLWGSLAMLWMPWVDYQKSYRSVALQLKSKLPVAASCLAGRGLGVSQAAALDYHGGIRTQPFDLVKPAACPLVLVQGSPQHELDAPAAGPGQRWTKLADVGRPGDRAERFRLYRLER